MIIRKPLLALLVVASLGGVTHASLALADVEIFYNRAPPPARHEMVPAPRRGYVWTPGYWDAKNNKHFWRKGHWERARNGQVYVPPRWIERNNGWALERGRWNPNDRDGDGVPNNRDRQPDNPRRN